MHRLYDWLLFDADDTLFDFSAASLKAISETLVQFGIEQHAKYLRLYEALNDVMWFRGDKGELTQQEITQERFRHFLAAIGREELHASVLNTYYIQALAKQGILLDGALETVQTLHAAGYRMAVVTNGVASVQHGRFSGNPITPYFERIFISEELGVRKPSPDFFAAVRRELGIEQPRRVLVIGDSLHSDILGGNLANFDTMWYNFKLEETSDEITPRYQVQSYRQLLEVLGEA